MPKHRTQPTRGRARSGRVVAFGLVVAGFAASATAAGGRPITGLSEALVARSGAPRYIHASHSLQDVAGAPIPFGAAQYFGTIAQQNSSSAVVAMAASQSGLGYLLVTGSGGVFGFGDARFHGSVAAWHKAHVVAITATGNGGGYWLACDSGQIFSFGDARFHGSPGGQLSTPIVAMAATPDGKGYWLAASGGRVFGYGDADVYGSATPELHGDHIVAMAATPDAKGYWLVASGGRVFHFGDADSYGSAAGELGSDHIVAMAATPDAKGYWLVASGGRVFHYGDAQSYGSASGELGNDYIVAMAATPDGRGYWLLASTPPPVGLPAPGAGFLAGHVTAIGDSVMLDAQPALEADIPGIDVEAAVSRQWDAGVALAQQLKSEDRLGAIVVIDLGTNGPVSTQQFIDMMKVLSGASRVVFVTVHLPPHYSWANSVNATLEQSVPKYPRDRLADFNKLADENPQWFYSDGVHMPIGGVGAQAMARLIKSEI
ncbi:MAG: hypothetical protein ABSA65_01505 [Acidimicrobiales bacterium]|jgi:hypothetical protein